MKLLDLLPSQPSWDVIDASKLTTYMTCPRKYFYAYILGWQPEIANVDLVFGNAWHLAVEHLMNQAYSASSLTTAYQLFYNYFSPHFEEYENDHKVKNLTTANIALMQYYNEHKHEVTKWYTLHTEVGGTVEIDNGVHLAFKMDAILQDLATGNILGMDHKTSQRYVASWGDKWKMSTQMNTYLFALMSYYPQDSEPSLLVRCTFLYDQSPTTAKRGRNRKPTPCHSEDMLITRTPEQLERWRVHTVEWVNSLRNDTAALMHTASTNDNILSAFPMNDTQCTLCPYIPLCNSWSNPLTRCTMPPTSYTIRHWNPLSVAKEIVK